MSRASLPVLLLLWPACVSAQAGHDVLVLGEVHDNPAHHAEQARIIAEVQPAALLFEMLTPRQAAAAEGVDRSDAKALAAALGWEGTGWPDFALYAPLFAAAPEAAVFGMALPREMLARARDEGAAAVFGEGAADWGLGPLPPEVQAAREAEQQAAHCGLLPAGMLPGFVAVQRLWDAHFARAAAAVHDATGGPVVVIAGTFHARTDTGIPFHLGKGRPDLSVWALGQFEGAAPADPPFDAVNVTPAPPRADPCTASD